MPIILENLIEQEISEAQRGCLIEAGVIYWAYDAEQAPIYQLCDGKTWADVDSLLKEPI